MNRLLVSVTINSLLINIMQRIRWWILIGLLKDKYITNLDWILVSAAVAIVVVGNVVVESWWSDVDVDTLYTKDMTPRVHLAALQS